MITYTGDPRPEYRRVPKKVKISCACRLRYAVKNGTLIKPEKCSKCGNTKSIQGHHEDYYKPFKVVWLCGVCHYKRHEEEFKKERRDKKNLKKEIQERGII